MPKKKKQTNSLAEQIKEVESQILTNSKDVQFAKKLIRKTADLNKQSALSGVELQVTTKSITDCIDFGETKVERCSQGFLFTAKGGLQTLVSWRMKRVCDLLDAFFNIRDNFSGDDLDADTKQYYQMVQTAILYVFQAPIFASYDTITLLDIATAVISSFRKETEKDIDEIAAQGATEETEQDVKENIEAENQEKLLEEIVKEGENLPDYDD